MSEEELKEAIEKYKSITGTNKVWLVDENFISECKRQIRAECIDILNGIDKQVAEIVKGVWEQQDAK